VQWGLLYGVRQVVRNGVRGPKIVRIWSAWVSLLTSMECRGPFTNVEAVHGQQSRCGGVPRKPGPR
jgi:hypothetical protein